MNEEFKSKLKLIERELPQVIKRLPGVAKVEGLDFIHDNFEKEGFEDKPGSVRKWPKRKAPKVWRSVKSGKKSSKLKATKAGKKHLKDLDKNRNLLVLSGKLRRSWDKESSANETQSVFTSSMPGSEAHNEGGRAGRGSGFLMPERKMIGDSLALTARIEKKLDKMVAKVFE